MAVESIAKTLGAGSGIDVKALVDSLVDAQFSTKKEQLKTREEALEAQISGVSKLRQTITQFDTALKSLVRGGALSTKLTSSNEGAVKASTSSGAAPGQIPGRVGVVSVAAAQVSTTDDPIPAGDGFRAGALTLRFGRDGADGFVAGGPETVIPVEAGMTLADVAAAINAAQAGVTARIVADGAGQRLSVSGPMGADKAFEIVAADADGTAAGRGLAGLAVGTGATGTSSASRASDAVLTVDGVRYTRQSNLIEDLAPGVRLELIAPTTVPAVIGVTRPTTALTQAVEDFVAAYNETLALVREQSDAVSGALRSDSAVEAMRRDLQRLSTSALAPAGAPGAPTTLAEIGVATARDGTLSLDPGRLVKALVDFPSAVEKLFDETAGLPAALGAVTRRVTDRTAGLDASTATYGKRKAELADVKAKAADQEAALRARLTRQYASMDARVAAYKATQTFMDNQIKAWNRSDA